MRQLIARGGEVSYCDPWVPEFELDGVLHSSVEWSAKRVAEADCIVLLTQHADFLRQPLWDRARLIVDTRNVVPDGDNVKRI
jgi:UDP-N-acetyl-D-mannosaminuronate dehydrogenase